MVGFHSRILDQVCYCIAQYNRGLNIDILVSQRAQRSAMMCGKSRIHRITQTVVAIGICVCGAGALAFVTKYMAK